MNMSSLPFSRNSWPVVQRESRLWLNGTIKSDRRMAFPSRQISRQHSDPIPCQTRSRVNGLRWGRLLIGCSGEATTESTADTFSENDVSFF